MTDQTATAAPDAPADTSPAANDAGKKTDHSAFQKRIDRLTWEKHELSRQLQAARTPKEEPKPAETGRKKLADFDFDEDAYEAYLDERTDKRLDSKLDQRTKTEKAKAEQDARVENWQKQVAKLQKESPEALEKIYSIPDEYLTEHVLEALTESDVAGQLAVHLADNPDVAEQLSRLSPNKLARAIGRLESKFDVKDEPAPEAEDKGEEPSKVEAKQEPRVTKAPAPTPKLTETDSGSKKAWNDPALSQEEFNKRRRAQLKRG